MECFPLPDHEDWVQKNYYILKKFINRFNNISLIILNKGISSRNIKDDKKKFIKLFSNKINIIRITKRDCMQRFAIVVLVIPFILLINELVFKTRTKD